MSDSEIRAKRAVCGICTIILGALSLAYGYNDENKDRINKTWISVSSAFFLAGVGSFAAACFPKLPDKINQTISGCMENVHSEPNGNKTPIATITV